MLEPMEFIGDLSLAAGEASAGPPRFSILAYTGGLASMPKLRLASDDLSELTSVVIDLASLVIPADAIPVRLDHDASKPIGHGVARLAAGFAGLPQVMIDGLFSVPGPDSKKVVDSYANKFPWRASIGLAGGRYAVIEPGESVRVNGRDQIGPFAVFSGCTLTEISVVDRGADPNTRVAIQMKELPMLPMPTEPIETPALPAETVTAPAVAPATGTLTVAMLSAAHAALSATPINDPAEREAFVEGLASGRYGSVGEMKLAALEASFAKAPRMPAPIKPGAAPHVAFADADDSTEIIGAAFAEHCGMASHLPAATREKAERLAKPYGGRGLSLQGALLALAAKRGVNAQRISLANFGQIMSAALSSTVDAPNVLADTVQRKATTVYGARVDPVAKLISRAVSLNDFRPHTMAGAYGDIVFLPVNENGQPAHAVVKDQGYTVRAATTARTLSLSRQMVINDDTGALMDFASMLGVGAAQAVNNSVWQLWATTLTGAAFWTAGRVNLLTGGGSALGAAGLTAAVSALAKLQSPAVNGRQQPMNQVGKYLLVPPELKATADALYVSTTLKGSTDGPDANIHAGQYTPLSTSFLSAASPYPADLTGWYLMVAPTDSPTVLIGYLNGVEGPTITQNTNQFGPVEGMGFTGFLDYGVAMGEPLASVRSAGA